MKKAIDIGVFLSGMTGGMTVQELEEWKAQMPIIAERHNLDLNGVGAKIVREGIDAAIKSKQRDNTAGM